MRRCRLNSAGLLREMSLSATQMHGLRMYENKMLSRSVSEEERRVYSAYYSLKYMQRSVRERLLTLSRYFLPSTRNALVLKLFIIDASFVNASPNVRKYERAWCQVFSQPVFSPLVFFTLIFTSRSFPRPYIPR